MISAFLLVCLSLSLLSDFLLSCFRCSDAQTRGEGESFWYRLLLSSPLLLSNSSPALPFSYFHAWPPWHLEFTVKLTVFRDSPGSSVLLCPVRKQRYERKVMSVPPGCLLNLRRHYFTTQHDCIHIIPHPAKVALTQIAWRPCNWRPVGELGLTRETGTLQLFALMDSRIKLWAQWVTNQPVSKPEESISGSCCSHSDKVKTATSKCHFDKDWLTYAFVRWPSLRSHSREIAALIFDKDGMLLLSAHQS